MGISGSPMLISGDYGLTSLPAPGHAAFIGGLGWLSFGHQEPAEPGPIGFLALMQFRNYCGLITIARCGFPWKKTTKRSTASVYTNCETALSGLLDVMLLVKRGLPGAISTWSD
jgi:hypothetical protein